MNVEMYLLMNGYVHYNWGRFEDFWSLEEMNSRASQLY